MKRHGRKTNIVKRSTRQKRVNVEVGPRSVPKLSDGQKALWTGLGGDAFSVDAVAADFKKRYRRGAG